MQIKKEILLFFSLVLLCITLITAANLSPEPATAAKKVKCGAKCCQTDIKNNSNTSPWNFITHGILHLSA